MAEAVLGQARKAPGDTLKQSIDFRPDLPAGATLVSATGTLASGGGAFSVGGVTTDDTHATVTVTGGKKGEIYEVLVEGTYSDGQVRGFLLPVVVL